MPSSTKNKNLLSLNPAQAGILSSLARYSYLAHHPEIPTPRKARHAQLASHLFNHLASDTNIGLVETARILAHKETGNESQASRDRATKLNEQIEKDFAGISPPFEPSRFEWLRKQAPQPK